MLEQEKTQLIILGNGFDLQAGLKSKYEDFFACRFAGDGPISAEMQRLTSRPLSWTAAETSVTVWDYLFQLEREKRKKGWADIELFIKNTLINRESHYYDISAHLNSSKANFSVGDLYLGMANIIKGRYIKVDLFKYKAFDDGSFREILLEELKRFENGFLDYLQKEVQKNSQYPEKALSLFNAIVETTPCLLLPRVLSFNYTAPIELSVWRELVADIYRRAGEIHSNGYISSQALSAY